MRIGIDAREFKKGVHTGMRTILGDFLRNIRGTGEHEFVFFADRYTDTEALPGFGKKALLPGDNVFLRDQYHFPRALWEQKIDVFFTPYIKTPLLRVCPYVNMICDIIPLEYPKNEGFKAFLEKAYFYIYALVCGRRAVKVLTLSEDARKKVSRVFWIGKEKIKVVYPSVAPAPEMPGKGTEVLEKYGLEKPYLLYVGNFKPHKNIDRLVSAFGSLPQEIKDVYKLLLVGGSRQEVDDMRRSVYERGLAGKIIPVANIGNAEVRVLLKDAEMFVFPSLAEGFGIPLIEAMASGVPVASSNLAPMTEVLADAAVYFNPNDPIDISRSILKLLQEKELREKCVKEGLQRSLVFKPEDMSLKIMDVIENAGAQKTLCVSSEFPPVRGGIATHIYNLWSRIDRKRICVFTARPSGARDCVDETLDIIRESYPLGRDIFSRTARVMIVSWHMFRQNCARKIKRNHCAQVLSAGLGGFLVKKIKGTPYVVYTYSADILEFSRNFLTLWIMKKVFSGCEHIIANSVFTKSLVTGHGLASADKVSVSTPAVDTEIFDPARGDGGIREKYGIKGERKMILTVSRLAARKGHENVLAALSDAVKFCQEITYVIVGEGPMRGQLEALVAEKGLEKNVIFAGEMPPEELVFFYNACDIFIMTPRHIKEEGDVEGFGIVFLEANACGKPVIAGKSGGVIEAVVDGETGFLVEPKDINGIRDAMLKLLNDEDLCRRLGERGRERVLREFDWASRCKKLTGYI